MRVHKFMMIGAVGLLAAGASADSMSFIANIENFGGNDPNGNGIGDAALIYEVTFGLPAIDSIDNVSFELAHSFLSDMHLTLQSPAGDLFLFARGRDSANAPPYNAPFDGGSLGDGGSSLGGVALYNFAQAGDVWNDGNGATDPAPGGTFASIDWFSGPFAAGDWTLQVIDAWDTVDDGALGEIVVSYTVPAPGALALVGIGGLALARRRRA
jgi:hypothetical protein